MSRVCGNVSAHIGTIRVIYFNRYFRLIFISYPSVFIQFLNLPMYSNVLICHGYQLFHNSSCNITNFSTCEDIHNLT